MKAIILILLTIFMTCAQVKAGLGKTIDECNALYGSGKITNYEAPHDQTIRYSHTFSADITVDFVDGVATHLYYQGSISQAQAKSYLEENSQGHKWILTRTETGSVPSETSEWERDDGAKAELIKGGISGDMMSFSAP